MARNVGPVFPELAFNPRVNSWPEDAGTSKTNEATPLLQDEVRAVDSDLYAIGGEQECIEEAIHEPQTDIEDIVKPLFSAWRRYSNKKSEKPILKNSDVLSPKALHAMSSVWRRLKTERDTLPEPEVIVRGLTASMVDFMYPLQPEGEEDLSKETFTAHMKEVVSEYWKRVLERVEIKEAQERSRKRKERQRRIRESQRRQRKRKEYLFFYEPFARIDNHVPLTCGTFCLFLCQCCSIFIFQFPIHTLLLAWPISIGVMGGLNLSQCPMSHLMPYVMMVMGVVGTTALLARLGVVIYEKFSGNQSKKWVWVALKVFEFAFLDLLVIQMYYFYSRTPSFVQGSSNYCNRTFYTFVHWINFVSMTIVSAWLFVYFIKGLLWLGRKKFHLRSQ